MFPSNSSTLTAATANTANVYNNNNSNNNNNINNSNINNHLNNNQHHIYIIQQQQQQQQLQQQQQQNFIEKLNFKTGRIPKLNLNKISNNIMTSPNSNQNTPTNQNIPSSPLQFNNNNNNSISSNSSINSNNNNLTPNGTPPPNFVNIFQQQHQIPIQQQYSPNSMNAPITPNFNLSGTLSPSKKVCKIYRDFCLKYSNLQTVHLRLNSSQELISISEALKQRHSITYLNLSHNKSIKEMESWIALGLALKAPNQTLNQINLSHNSLGTDGLSLIISDIIKTNRSITSINLSHNSLDQDENHSILEALQYNQTITNLDLSNNEYQLTLDVSSRLCSYIERSQTITHLNFSHNSNRHPLSGLPRALSINQSLRHLDLSCMTIAPTESVDLLKVLIGSRFLTSINLQQVLLSNVGESFGVCIVNALAKRYNDYDLDDESCISFIDSSGSSSNSNSSGNLLIVNPSTTTTTTTNSSSQTTTSVIVSNDIHSTNSSGNSITFTPSCSFSSSKSSVDDDEFYIAQHNPIFNLNLEGINFGKKALKPFLNILTRNQDLTVLDLSSSQLSESNGELLAEFIKKNNSIHTLNLSNNDFYEKSIEIVDALQFNKSITSLGLSNTKSSNLIGKVLAKSLSINHCIKKLNISHTKIAHSGIIELAQGLKENKIHLETLILDDTDLQDKGAAEIGDALKSNHYLQNLHLNFNSINSSGAKSIGKALKYNSTLKVLQLGYNEIGVKGLESISKSLKVNKSLIELSVKNNLIPEKGGFALTEALKVNQKLESINFRGNFLGVKGAASLTKLLTSNQTLTFMDLSHNNLDKIVTHKIHQLLKKNQITNTINLTSQTNQQLREQQQQHNQHQIIQQQGSSCDDLSTSPTHQISTPRTSSFNSARSDDGGIISSTDYYFVELNSASTGTNCENTPTTPPTLQHQFSFYHYNPQRGAGSSNNSPTAVNFQSPFGHTSYSQPSTPRTFNPLINAPVTPTAIRFPSQSNLPITPRGFQYQQQQQFISFHQSQVQQQQQQSQIQQQQLNRQLQQQQLQQQLQHLEVLPNQEVIQLLPVSHNSTKIISSSHIKSNNYN